MLGEGMKKRRGGARRPKPSPTAQRSGKRLSLWRWLLGGALGMAAAFGIGYLLAIAVLFPKPALAGDEVGVPDLVGMPLQDAREEVSRRELALDTVEQLVHPEVARGVVVAQSPLGGQRLRPGAGVKLAVSAGPAASVVPDLSGLPFESARELAERVGFQVQRRDDLSESARAGTVMFSVPDAGSQIEVPAPLLLVVSLGRPAEPETFDPDSALLPGETGGDDLAPGARTDADDADDAGRDDAATPRRRSF